MFGPLKNDENARIRALPPINRARGFRLYAMDGTRWVDCWADGGRAIAGHRPSGVSLRLKNEIDRGLYAPYPSRWESRLSSALLKMFPGYHDFRIFQNYHAAITAIELRSHPVDPLDLPKGTLAVPGAAWGRPLLPAHPIANILFPILPVPGFAQAQAVLFQDSPVVVQPSDPISPLILAALTRSCTAISEKTFLPTLQFADTWERRGPYMLFRGKNQDYTHLFDTLFARQVLIAPSPLRPSILPIDLSPGEWALLNARSDS